MNDNNFSVTNHKKRTIEDLKRDYPSLFKRLEEKEIGPYDYDTPLHFLEMLKCEIEELIEEERKSSVFTEDETKKR